MFSAWLHLSNECNFDCSYCYLHHSKDKMSLETGLQSVNAMFESAVLHDMQEVVLKYSGGEAVFNFEVLLAMQKKALQLSETTGIKLSVTLLTNGSTINEKLIPILQQYKINVAVGFDGLNEFQNIHRKYKNGKDTYNDVIVTLEKLQNAEILSDIAVTITDNNVENLPQFVEFLLQNEYPFNFSFYTENDKAMSKDLKLSENKIIRYLRESYKVIETYLPNRSYLSSLLDNVDLAVPHQYSCSIGKNYAVIDTNGNLSKCQMDVGQNKTFANVWQTDILESIQNDTTQLTPISVLEKTECADCEIKYYCAGGCPQLAIRSGSIKNKSPFCNIYKALYKDVLRLEALRILKYENGQRMLKTSE